MKYSDVELCSLVVKLIFDYIGEYMKYVKDIKNANVFKEMRYVIFSNRYIIVCGGITNSSVYNNIVFILDTDYNESDDIKQPPLKKQKINEI